MCGYEYTITMLEHTILSMNQNLKIEDKQVELGAEAAIRGGRHAAELQMEVQSDKKDDGSTVTEADYKVEKKIRKIISSQSSFGILGEELERDSDIDGDYWAVDPIDGTENYSRGQPLYTTCVALIRDGVPDVGITYVPTTNQLFYAKRGKGSYLNEKKISVSSTIDTDNLYVVADGYGSSKIHSNLTDSTIWIQRPHSAAYGIASVSTGWADIGVMGKLSVWDVASGIVLVEEAGGEIVPLSDNQNILNGGFLATNGNKVIKESVKSSISDKAYLLQGGK